MLLKAPIGIPIPEISPLNPSLGVVPPLPQRLEQLDDTAQMSPLSTFMKGLAFARQHSDSVFGTRRFDVARYGRLLKSRQLVGVCGAGLRVWITRAARQGRNCWPSKLTSDGSP